MGRPTPKEAETAWYERVRRALARAGVGEPAIVIDLDRLEANADRLAAGLPQGRALRLVQKSLPSLPLIRHLAPRLGCRRLMVFHRPFLNHYAVNAPEFDLLLGKPLPVAAARRFYDELPAELAAERSPAWLVDTDERLAQYQALARQLGLQLRVSVEIDVGLCRGGLSRPQQLSPLLDRIAADPRHLQWGGFMGYDSHAVQAPPWTSPSREVARASERYRGFIAWARERHPAAWHDGLVFNGAGSGTVPLHGADSPLNDLSVGSALVKPADFDVPSLDGWHPAALLATPVLKVQPGLRLPYLGALSRAASRCLPGLGRSIFLYGGKPMAVPVWPRGLRPNRLYGLSSNQQLMTLPADVPVAPDDSVLWRPTQSEAVLLQHGALLGVRGEEVVQRFEVDPV